MEIPFEFTTLYAFKLALTFDNKRSINVESLIKYREIVVDGVLKEFNKKYGFEETVQPIDYQQEFKYVLSEYEDVFYFNGKNLCIYDDISEDKINNLLKEINFELDDIFIFICKVSRTTEIFNLLGIIDIMNFDEQCKKIGYNIERKIEAAYMNNPYSPLIKKLLAQRTVLKMLIYTNNKNYIDQYYDIPSDDEVEIDEDFDYLKESEYTKLGDPYPIDNELYQNSEFYEDILEEFNPIQQRIEDYYQYAIFGNAPMFKDKYQLYMGQLYTNENSLEENEGETNGDISSDLDFGIDYDIDSEELAFYMIYINKLNQLIEAGYKQFEFIRNRLMYILDDVNLSLYNPDKFQKVYTQSTNYETDEDSFDLFENEAKYFIEDVFEGNAGKHIEKLLFTATFYQLTKNEDVIEVLNKYKKHPNYNIASSLILGTFELGKSENI